MPAYETFETPLGCFTVKVDERGRLVTAGFGGIEDLPERRGRADVDAALTAEARRQVEEYFAGRRRAFDLELAPAGSEFQQRYWRRLAQVRFGETTTYAALARELGSSPRAIGRANATNPICLVLPCHRIVGSDGSLTGYLYGTEIKQWLLDHEQEVVACAD